MSWDTRHPFVYRHFIRTFVSWPQFNMDSETDAGPERRRRVHGMLKLYYGLNEEGKAPEQPESLDPCDINGPHFEPELYLNKVKDPCCHVMFTLSYN